MPETVKLSGRKLGLTSEESRKCTEASEKILRHAYEVLGISDTLPFEHWAAKCGMETGLLLVCNLASCLYDVREIENVPRLMAAARSAICDEIDAIKEENVSRN